MDKSPVIPIATAPSPPPPMTSHPTTASTFERLENARIESADMQENMSKLSSFFDKYSKDKRFRIQDGWLRIKEESIQLLYKRCKLIENKLKSISSEYETLFDDLNCHSETLKQTHAIETASLHRTLETLSAEHAARAASFTSNEQESRHTIAALEGQLAGIAQEWKHQIDSVHRKTKMQRENNSAIQSGFETQMQSIEAQFFAQTDEIDSLFAKARAQATSPATISSLNAPASSSLVKATANKQTAGSSKNHVKSQNRNLWNLEINNINNGNHQNLSMTIPQSFDKISPINRMNAQFNHANFPSGGGLGQFPLRDKDLNMHFRAGAVVGSSSNHANVAGNVIVEGAASAAVAALAGSHENNNNDSNVSGGDSSESFESSNSIISNRSPSNHSRGSQCSHLSMSKNEGKWESRFESPSSNRDAQAELKQAILFLAEHMHLLNVVNNLTDYEKSGHIELLMHHIQATVRDAAGNQQESNGTSHSSASSTNGNSYQQQQQNLSKENMTNQSIHAIQANGSSSSSRNPTLGISNPILINPNSDAFKKKKNSQPSCQSSSQQSELSNQNHPKRSSSNNVRRAENEGERPHRHAAAELQSKLHNRMKEHPEGGEFESLTRNELTNEARSLPRTNDAHNSILDLVQGDDMSFHSRLPSLVDPIDDDDDEDERNAAFQFQKHVLQEDLLKVRQLNHTIEDISSYID